jgi:hypothetical protein
LECDGTRIVRPAGASELLKAPERQSVDVGARNQRSLVDQLLDVFGSKAIGDSPFDEQQPLDVLSVKSQVGASPPLPPRSLQQAKLPVETHLRKGHADSSG